jgi:hypothetical protein
MGPCNLFVTNISRLGIDIVAEYMRSLQHVVTENDICFRGVWSIICYKKL